MEKVLLPLASVNVYRSRSSPVNYVSDLNSTDPLRGQLVVGCSIFVFGCRICIRDPS